MIYLSTFHCILSNGHVKYIFAWYPGAFGMTTARFVKHSNRQRRGGNNCRLFTQHLLGCSTASDSVCWDVQQLKLVFRRGPAELVDFGSLVCRAHEHFVRQVVSLVAHRILEFCT